MKWSKWPGRRSGTELGRTTAFARDPLCAVPLVPEGVKAEATKDGVLVTRRLSAGRGLGGRIVAWLGGSYPVRVELDERGAAFWNRIDGHRPLASIAQDLEARFGVSGDEARRATIEFTKQLMRRNLIALKIEPS